MGGSWCHLNGYEGWDEWKDNAHKYLMLGET
jgi:hypothetical protein